MNSSSSIKKQQINEIQTNGKIISKIIFLFFICFFSEPTSTSSETYVDSSQNDDNERPTAIESATHEIPPADTTSTNNENECSAETILPIITPSFDEISSRIIQTNESSSTTTATVESEQQSQDNTNQPSTNNNEYINPRGIRFTTTTTTPTASGPVKGY
jgi:hypothetical protein